MNRLTYSARDDGQVTVHSWDPEGPGRFDTLLYLHGLGAYTGWHAGEFAAELAGRGRYRVVAPDLPGFGTSAALDFAGYAPPALADWVVDRVLGEHPDPVHLVGHSWGGELGCHIAARHPHRVRSLALLDGGHVGWDPVDPARAVADSRRFDEGRRFATEDEFLDAIRAERRRWSPYLDRAYRRGMLRLDGLVAQRQRPETFAAIRVGGARHPVAATWRELTGLPVLLAIAADNPAVEPRCPDGLAASVGDLTVVIVPDCSHFMIDDAGPRLAPLLVDWWGGGRSAVVVPHDG